jgi:hypothetical protein
VLAQFIVADDFQPVVVEGAFDKRQLDPAASARALRPRTADPRLPAPRSPRRTRAPSKNQITARPL